MDSPETSPPVVNRLASLPSPPATLPPWAKVLYYVAETVAIGVGFLNFDFGAPMSSTGGAAGGPDPDTWRRFVLHFADNQSAEPADDQVFTVDVVNLTDGQVDSTWNQSDYDQAMYALGSFAAALRSHIVSRLVCDRISAYVMAFRPYSELKPFAESGPPEFVQAQAYAGAAGPNVGPQGCSTITEETPSRAHWGRIYSPTIGTTSIGNDGRLTGAARSALATALHDTYAALMTNQLYPVVPTTQVDKVPARTLQAVTGVRVDDVLDVHRSRRHKFAQNRTILPVTAAQQPAGGAAARPAA